MPDQNQAQSNRQSTQTALPQDVKQIVDQFKVSVLPKANEPNVNTLTIELPKNHKFAGAQGESCSISFLGKTKEADDQLTKLRIDRDKAIQRGEELWVPFSTVAKDGKDNDSGFILFKRQTNGSHALTAVYHTVSDGEPITDKGVATPSVHPVVRLPDTSTLTLPKPNQPTAATQMALTPNEVKVLETWYTADETPVNDLRSRIRQTFGISRDARLSLTTKDNSAIASGIVSGRLEFEVRDRKFVLPIGFEVNQGGLSTNAFKSGLVNRANTNELAKCIDFAEANNKGHTVVGLGFNKEGELHLALEANAGYGPGKVLKVSNGKIVELDGVRDVDNKSDGSRGRTEVRMADGTVMNFGGPAPYVGSTESTPVKEAPKNIANPNAQKLPLTASEEEQKNTELDKKQIVGIKAEVNSTQVDLKGTLATLAANPNLRVVGVGESHDKKSHNNDPQNQLIRDVLKNLKDKGFGTLVLEVDADQQEALNEALKMPYEFPAKPGDDRWKDRIGAIGRAVSSGGNTSSGIHRVIDFAESEGFKIKFVDKRGDYASNDKKEIAEERESATFKNIDKILTENPNERVVMFYGGAHLGTGGKIDGTRSTADRIKQKYGEDGMKSIGQLSPVDDRMSMNHLTEDLKERVVVDVGKTQILKETPIAPGVASLPIGRWDYFVLHPYSLKN